MRTALSQPDWSDSYDSLFFILKRFLNLVLKQGHRKIKAHFALTSWYAPFIPSSINLNSKGLWQVSKRGHWNSKSCKKGTSWSLGVESEDKRLAPCKCITHIAHTSSMSIFTVAVVYLCHVKKLSCGVLRVISRAQCAVDLPSAGSQVRSYGEVPYVLARAADVMGLVRHGCAAVPSLPWHSQHSPCLTLSPTFFLFFSFSTSSCLLLHASASQALFLLLFAL